MKKLEKIEYLNTQRIFKDKDIKWTDDILNSIKVLKKYEKDIIIKEGDSTSDVFFIFKGKVNILVKNKKVATRKAGEHIGEIVALFYNFKRTATCIIAEESIVAKMSSHDFKKLLDDNPMIYKEISYTLAERLEQRNSMVISNINKKHKPTIFIGSSTKSKRTVEFWEQKLKKICYVKKWYKNVFKPSKTTIENLEKQISNCDFSLLILSKDDKRNKNGNKNLVDSIPRDNVIFELGLSIGKLTRDRCFCVKTEKNLILPTDLKGITYLTNKDYKILIQEIKEKGVIKNV